MVNSYEAASLLMQPLYFFSHEICYILFLNRLRGGGIKASETWFKVR